MQLPTFGANLSRYRISELARIRNNKISSNLIQRQFPLTSPLNQLLIHPYHKLLKHYSMESRTSVTNWTSSEVRNAFINFFEENGHQEWKSSPVVPHNDPTLLFINAGMNQFKPLFLRQSIERSAMAQLKRAANSQKCIRAGGKHNDLDDVGKDVYHHTFFEMLGSWSFGDYFKEDAIEFAWNLLVNKLKLDPDRIYVTYFGGDPKQPDCPSDLESKSFWKKFLPAERILPFGMKDNFWEMAETGPCGPCSEIHYDRIGDRDAANLVNADDPNVLEIWNLVFMQFNRDESGTLKPLPAPCVDTGMGFERLLSVLQGVDSNYDTDLFAPIFKSIHDTLSVATPYQGKLGEDDAGMVDTSYRVIADHIRCLTVAISDGATPSNVGRGYVLRRILRRALRYGYQYLNAPSDKSWLYLLVDSVMDTLGIFFTDLLSNRQKIKNIIKEEEHNFSTTLTRGMEHFQRILSKITPTDSSEKIFPASAAFTLQSSYGFPLELTMLMVEESNYKVDMEEYEKLQEEHRLISQSKKAANTAFRGFSITEEHYLRNNAQVPNTEDFYKYEFSTSQTNQPAPTNACIMAVFVGDFVDKVPNNMCALILDKTCFYAEQGGQVSDMGTIFSENGQFTVESVKSFSGYVLHIGYLTNGTMNVGDSVQLNIDWQLRKNIAYNHTATHALGFALRKISGSECKQKGSLVDGSHLRFDFEFDSEENADTYINAIQNHVNKMIQSNLKIYTQEVDLASAHKIVGVRAVFGENYPDPVRVVSIGKDVSEILTCEPDEIPGYEYSIEFCGGTHIEALGEIKNFVILEHSSISKGVRRIEACTNEAAFKIVENDKQAIEYITQLENTSVEKLAFINNLEEIDSLSGLRLSRIVHSNLKERLNIISKKQLAYAKKKTSQMQENVTEYGLTLVSENKSSNWFVEDMTDVCANTKLLDKALNVFIDSNKAAFLYISGKQSVNVVCSVPTLYESQISAVEWVNFALKNIGKGGGNSSKAYGGAKLSSNINPIQNLATQYAQNKFSN